MIKIDNTKMQKIHTRRIDIATYEGGSDSVFLPGAVERIKDTCRVWRSDGPLIKGIEK
ncbi:hypothetical protein ACFL2S_08905 [Thermodesulfobacteriota bacterium]